jgi:outer membrane immunogenic protein
MHLRHPRLAMILAVIASVTCTGVAQAEGLRAEIHGGFDRLSNERFFSPSDSTFRPVEGGVYGFGIGYDQPLGKQVFVGLEGNADFSTGSRCQVNPLVAFVAPGIFESCLRPGRDLSANARFGVNLGSRRTRLYALAGYSNVRLISSFQMNRGPRTELNSQNRDGIRVGAGLEHGFDDRFYAKIEYRYSDYGNRINRNQALAGVGIRF